LTLFVWRQLWLVRTRRPVNLPKILLLVAALGTHGLVFFFTATPFLIAEALETTYHDVQYQGWMRHYQKRRFGPQVLRRWLFMALAYGCIVGVIEVVAYSVPALGWIFIPFGMIVLWHYWVDGKIWRMRQQPELRKSVL